MDLIRQLTPVVVSIHFRPNLKEIGQIGDIGIASAAKLVNAAAAGFCGNVGSFFHEIVGAALDFLLIFNKPLNDHWMLFIGFKS
jgi:hypothetical protein